MSVDTNFVLGVVAGAIAVDYIGIHIRELKRSRQPQIKPQTYVKPLGNLREKINVKNSN